MTPRMADQYSTLRRELKDVQRSLADLQRRLTVVPSLEPLPYIDEGRPRAMKPPTGNGSHHDDDDRLGRNSDAVGQYRLAGDLPLPAGARRRSPTPASSTQTVSGPSRDLVRRQNATLQDDGIEATATSDPANEDASAVFTLCL